MDVSSAPLEHTKTVVDKLVVAKIVLQTRSIQIQVPQVSESVNHALQRKQQAQLMEARKIPRAFAGAVTTIKMISASALHVQLVQTAPSVMEY
jgi:hypothetical protein